MKKKTLIVSLMLAFALVLGSFQAAFASFGIEGTAGDGKELDVETAAMAMYNDAADGKYKLVDTATLKKWVNKKSAVIVDTMPAGSFAAHRIPGAINAECGDNGLNGKFTAAQKKALLKAVEKKVGKKTVTKYYNTKTKKWQTKKIKGAKTKKVKEVNKSKKIVVYCGFVKCRRSHWAAKYLVSKGYTNVYRQPGGIAAWGDAKYPIEGTDK